MSTESCSQAQPRPMRLPSRVQFPFSQDEEKQVAPSSQDMEILFQENMEYFCRSRELEEAIEIEKREQQKLRGKVLTQEQTIGKLVNQMSQSKDDEVEMANEIFALKKDLAKERKLVAKLSIQIERGQAADNSNIPSVMEVRERELIERLKESRESLELSRQEVQRINAKLLCLEEEREHLITRIANQNAEIKETRTRAGEGEKLKGVNEALELQLDETRKRVLEQLGLIEELRKENFDLLRRPAPVILQSEDDKENVEKTLHLQLRRRIDRLENEKYELLKKVESLTELQERSGSNELELLKQLVDEQRQDLKNAEDSLVAQRCETEKVTVQRQQLETQLEVTKTLLEEETLRWLKRIEELSERLEKVEQERNHAEEALENQGSSKKEIIEQLYASKSLAEKLQTENYQLENKIQTLDSNLQEEKENNSRLRAEIEEKLKTEITRLQQESKELEFSMERLKGDFELKVYLLKEEQDVARQAKNQLDSIQQKLEESEVRLTSLSRLTSDQAKKLAIGDAERKQKDYEFSELKKKMSSCESKVAKLQHLLQDEKASHEKLAKDYESLEYQHARCLEDQRQCQSDVVFYREELERLADYQTSHGSSRFVSGTREERLGMTAEALKQQIFAAKDELSVLQSDIKAQLRNLPIQESSENSEEFEIVHIVDHFQSEKRKVTDELRNATLKLSQSELACQSLFEQHQALKISHARTLKELLDLKHHGRLKCDNPVVSSPSDTSCNSELISTEMTLLATMPNIGGLLEKPEARQPTEELKARQPTEELKAPQPTEELKARQPTEELKARQPTESLEARQPTDDTASKLPKSLEVLPALLSARSTGSLNSARASATKGADNNKSVQTESGALRMKERIALFEKSGTESVNRPKEAMKDSEMSSQVFGSSTPKSSALSSNKAPVSEIRLSSKVLQTEQPKMTDKVDKSGSTRNLVKPTEYKLTTAKNSSKNGAEARSSSRLAKRVLIQSHKLE